MATLRLLVVPAALVAGLAIFPTGSSAPRVPTDAAEVLASLPGGPGDLRGRALGELRRALASSPTDLELALRTARLALELARERSDPRFLGQAQAALGRWPGDDAPAPVLVLRATIEQSLHDFDAALRHLDLALAAAPDDPQAWLTRATILALQARFEEARASCQRLPMGLARAVCEASVDGLTGAARAGARRLEAALALWPSSKTERLWATSVRGELALRLGEVPTAEQSFRSVLALDPDDAYARAVLADLLLDAGRLDEVRALVAGREADDGLLLRRALADGPRSAAAEALEVRVAEARARGDVVHRREEARFRLLLGEPATALQLARENWEVQKEPADARVLLEAARAAGASAGAVLVHLARTRLEDPVIARLAREVSP